MSSSVQPNELSRLWHEHRPKFVASVLVILASATLLAVAWLAYDLLVAPPVPDLETATPQQVAEYLTDKRGWRRLSVSERKRWLTRLVHTYQDPAQIEAFASALRRTPVNDRRVFVDGFVEMAKPELMADARAFAKVRPRDRNRFLQDKLASYDSLSLALSDLGTPFGAALPNTSPGWTKLLVERTSPGERAIAKPYIDGLSEMARAVRGGRRSDPYAPGQFQRGGARSSERHRGSLMSGETSR